MCGIAGCWLLRHDAIAIAQAMSDCVKHRGPDGEGLWSDGTEIALAHRRLAIVDLSEQGRQPMVSQSGRYIITFNGEIYNCAELRNELTPFGHAWRGHSDTEIMLAAFEKWGPVETLPRLVGMFAFALWDTKHRSLMLARDRFGKKPLYYSSIGGTAFASDLRALLEVPELSKDLDMDALASFLQLNNVPGSQSILKAVQKLPPATYAVLNSPNDPIKPFAYWSAVDAVRAARANPWQGDPLPELERILRLAVRERMQVDVPFGALLSGGIDSAAVVAMMQAESDEPVRTFTIGFESSEYDEANKARAVAEHLGTDHVEFYLAADDALKAIECLPEIYSEPFGDSSQIPTLLVAQMARKYVTVALTGDGGDELFAGYNRYLFADRLAKLNERVPKVWLRAARRTLSGVPEGVWRGVSESRLRPGALRMRLPAQKIHKLRLALGAQTPEALYQGLLSHWPDGAKLLQKAGVAQMPGLAEIDGKATVSERMMLSDSIGYLTDDILVKTDRASMAHALELRSPFLDHRLFEFSWRLGFDQKVRERQSKWILRQLLDRRVPRKLMDSPKTGFGVPVGEWLRGPLKDWAADLLDPQAMERDGIFRSAPIQKAWQQHQAGVGQWQDQLWCILMFQMWKEQYDV